MEIAVKTIIISIVYILQDVLMGTNLGIARMLWSMVNESFLGSCGAIHNALFANRFSDKEIRRRWAFSLIAANHGLLEIPLPQTKVAQPPELLRTTKV